MPSDYTKRAVRLKVFMEGELRILKMTKKYFPFKDLIKARGMTQAELAAKVGCSTRVITYWVTGRNVPSLREAYYLASALGVSLEDLAIMFLNQ